MRLIVSQIYQVPKDGKKTLLASKKTNHGSSLKSPGGCRANKIDSGSL